MTSKLTEARRLTCEAKRRAKDAETIYKRERDKHGLDARRSPETNRPGPPRKSAIDYIVDARTGCWNWQRGDNGIGYGKVWDGERVVMAHRHYYELHKGPIPDGMQLDHLCRNPACVNPDHLEPVTHAENGQRGNRAKLTPAKVREIRRLATDGQHYRNLMTRFGVSKATVHAVLSGRSWGNVL